MELIDQRTKVIMEECKLRARDAGLSFSNETLEYILTNRDLTRLLPKNMIPTLYDYWVQDVAVHRGQKTYELYPHNPYETVINTRPPMSFYNDNNPDWLNVMIFYHVLAHIDFFQNNWFFRQTWSDDFTGKALADKRLIEEIRRDRGADRRWVDYVIEFSRGVDNLVGFFPELDSFEERMISACRLSERMDYFFGPFWSSIKWDKKGRLFDLVLQKYNELVRIHGDKRAEEFFFHDKFVTSRFREFEANFKKFKEEKKKKGKINDLLQFIMHNADFLQKEDNKWMKRVMQVVRETSLYFQPMMRTRIMNEGWASYWHKQLFLQDERMRGHEVSFAKVDSSVTAMPKIGLNPYALGSLMFEYIKEMSGKGCLSFEFRGLKGIKDRKDFDKHLGEEVGMKTIFSMRESLNDRLFIDCLPDEDFQDFMNRHKLFVAGAKLNQTRRTVEYFIKSRRVIDYRQMLKNVLYHPPYVEYSVDNDGTLNLEHIFEGKQLLTQWIPAVLGGLVFFWKNDVRLETTEFEQEKGEKDIANMPWWHSFASIKPQETEKKLKQIRVLYTMSKAGIMARKVL